MVFFERYKPGTKPMGAVTQNEAEEIKSLFISMINQTGTDFGQWIIWLIYRTEHDNRVLSWKPSGCICV
jgi:hypothetical protein